MARYSKTIPLGAFIAAIASFLSQSATAAPGLAEGRNVLAPFSFVKFCVDYPAECPKDAGAARVHLTAEKAAELSAINRQVNGAIQPTPDHSAMRYWRLNVAKGDCNAYAVQKRHELLQRGWPAGALALTVVKTAWGEGHLVVTVRTDGGDLVLDNLRTQVIAANRTGYHWIMRQSERDPELWVALSETPSERMASLDDADEAAPTADSEEAAPAQRLLGPANHAKPLQQHGAFRAQAPVRLASHS